MKIEGNKVNYGHDDIDQLTFDIATQLCHKDIQQLCDNLQWVLLGCSPMGCPSESRVTYYGGPGL